MTTRVKIIQEPGNPSIKEVTDFDTFVEACDYVRNNLGPTLSEGFVIQLETLD